MKARRARSAAAVVLAVAATAGATVMGLGGHRSHRVAALPAPGTPEVAAPSVPLRFEANVGQADGGIDFLVRGSREEIGIGAGAAIVDVGDGRRVRIGLAGGTARVSPEPSGSLGATNYLVGADPARWRRGVENYDTVTYREVRPGVDVVFHGRRSATEYDLIVAPGADASSLRLDVTGAESVHLDPNGDLAISTAGTTLVQHRPSAYQDVAGTRRAVDAGYSVGDDGVAFTVGAYDHSVPLVIDPLLDYFSYLGSPSVETVYDVAMDSSGMAYLFGNSVNGAGGGLAHPPSPVSPYLGGADDDFVAKIDPAAPAGQSLEWITYLGGSGTELADTSGVGSASNAVGGIAVDGAGEAHVVGTTASADFPVTPTAFQPILQSTVATDVFVSKLNATGDRLLYSTYLGATGEDRAGDIALDAQGRAWVVGSTFATPNTNGTSTNDFPAATQAPPVFRHSFQPQSTDGGEGFLAHIDTAANGQASLLYATYLGPTTYASGVAVGPTGRVHVVGTATMGLPARFAFSGNGSSGFETSYLEVFDPTGTLSVYATYDQQHAGGPVAVVVDGAGMAYVVGGALQGYIDKFNPDATPDGAGRGPGSRLFSYPLTGNRGAFAQGVALDATGNVWVAGETQSTDFAPISPDALQPNFGGGGGSSPGPPPPKDAFVTAISGDGSSVVYSSYFGTTTNESARAIAVRGGGPGTEIVFAGTADGGVGATPNAVQATSQGAPDAFVARLHYPLPTIDVADVTVIEPKTGTAPAQFAVTVSPAPTGTVTVDWATADGTASSVPPDADYQAGSGTLTIAAGQTAAQISVDVLADTLTEPQSIETFTVHLTNPSTGLGLGRSIATGSVLDQGSTAPPSSVPRDTGPASKDSGQNLAPSSAQVQPGGQGQPAGQAQPQVGGQSQVSPSGVGQAQPQVQALGQGQPAGAGQGQVAAVPGPPAASGSSQGAGGGGGIAPPAPPAQPGGAPQLQGGPVPGAAVDDPGPGPVVEAERVGRAGREGGAPRGPDELLASPLGLSSASSPFSPLWMAAWAAAAVVALGAVAVAARPPGRQRRLARVPVRRL